MLSDLSQLGMEFGQYVHQVLRDLVIGTVLPASLSVMERGVREAMLKLGHFLLTRWLAVQNDRYPAATIPCRCGATAHYREMRAGVLLTTVGRVAYRRAYYLCEHCHQGTYPLDERLGLRPGQMSAELENLAALVGAQLPFEQASALLEQLTLVRLSPQSLDKATQALGAERQAVEAEWLVTSQDPAALLQQAREEAPPARLYGTIDATKVHTTERRDDPDAGWRDLKVGAWFTTEARPPAQPDDDWEIQARDITYFCDIQEAETFGDLVWATGYRRRAPRGPGTHFSGRWGGLDLAPGRPALSPGRANRGLVPRRRILAPPWRRALARPLTWLQQARADLWAGRVAEVIAACAAQVTPGNADDPAQKAVTYFTNNQHRMNYPAYRARGYQIGSGTIESGCKQIGTCRLKVPGASWHLESARRVAKARAALLSDEWDELVQRRTHLAAAA